MNGHVHDDVLQRLRRRELPPEELISTLRHVGECAECRSRADAGTDAGAERVAAVLAAEADHTMTQQMDEHLAACEPCREDVAGLQSTRAVPARRPRWTWLAAAAAGAVVLVTAILSRDEPAPAPVIAVDPPPPATRTETAAPPYENVEWNALVAKTLASGRLPYPADLDDLRGESDTLRGEPAGATALLVPAGVVIDDVRPAFSWPATGNATYVVSVYDGDDEVARSESIRASSWTPRSPLRRGRTYAWQVEVTANGTTESLPSPDMPPAMFRIVSEQAHAELEAARAHHPNDHLLLAVLSARAGLKAEAAGHLRASSDPRVKRLAEER